MITPFPVQRQHRADPLGWALALHTVKTAEEDEQEGLEWVRWLFQSIHARCPALLFQSSSQERAGIIADWQRFADDIFLPKLAPTLLQAWKMANAGADSSLLDLDHQLHLEFSEDMAARSLSAGAMLLEQTRGAKHQAALGRYRRQIEEGKAEGHLVIVWAAVASLFQLPPLDLLSEYLHEEWIVGTRECSHHERPQGPISFEGLALKAIHASNALGIQGSASSSSKVVMGFSP